MKKILLRRTKRTHHMLLTRFCSLTIKVTLDWFYFSLSLLMFSSISGKNNINTLTRHPKNVAFQSNSSPVMHSSAECFVLRSKLFQQHLFDPRVWPDESHFMQTLRHSLPAINIIASILASCSTHQYDLLYSSSHFTFLTTTFFAVSFESDRTETWATADSLNLSL